MTRHGGRGGDVQRVDSRGHGDANSVVERVERLLSQSVTFRAQHDGDLLLKIFEGSENPLLAFSHFAKSLTAEQLADLQQSLGRE